MNRRLPLWIRFRIRRRLDAWCGVCRLCSYLTGCYPGHHAHGSAAPYVFRIFRIREETLMFDLFVSCRDPYINSLFGCIGTAVVSTKQEGAKVALMITQEALVALAEKKFAPAPLLVPYMDKITSVLKQLEFPEDPVEMVKMAVNEGVKVFTCELWAGMMAEGSLPPELEVVPVDELIRIISGSKKILGSF